VVESVSFVPEKQWNHKYGDDPKHTTKRQGLSGNEYHKHKAANPSSTTSWEPTCTHGREPVPATILDPFGGACTTALVATKLNRGYIMIDLNPEYVEMARQRLHDEIGLFAGVGT